MLNQIPQQIWIGLPAIIIALALLSFAPVWGWPWIIAAALFVLFLSHHQNWRGRLTTREINAGLQQFSDSPDVDDLRSFFENDDGREFFMVNLIQIKEGTIPHPDTGKDVPAHKLVEDYSRPFFRAALARGGYPLLLVQRRGGDIDSWGASLANHPRWPLVNLVRYRSRRDMLQLVNHPAFTSIHRFKREAIAQTISFPNRMLMAGFASPPILVGLVLSLFAALATVALLAAS